MNNIIYHMLANILKLEIFILLLPSNMDNTALVQICKINIFTYTLVCLCVCVCAHTQVNTHIYAYINCTWHSRECLLGTKLHWTQQCLCLICIQRIAQIGCNSKQIYFGICIAESDGTWVKKIWDSLHLHFWYTVSNIVSL